MPPTDTTLLLRVHAEDHWLQSELLPMLRRLEAHLDMPDEDIAAALSNLETAWAEALRRARETDEELARLERDAACARGDGLVAQARGYYGWVRAMSRVLTERVDMLVGGRPGASGEQFGPATPA